MIRLKEVQTVQSPRSVQVVQSVSEVVAGDLKILRR